MEHVIFAPQGVCCKKLEFDFADGKVYNVKFHGGCPGNLIAISNLCEGATIELLISKFDGVKCGLKPTSCTDQFAQCLKEL